MSAQALLDRLEKVRATGRGQWLACCPAHEDRSPSMTVRECDDGRVLVYCFAGCGFEAIVSAAGISIDELFPEKPHEHKPPLRRPFNAHDVLSAVANEAAVVAIYAADVHKGVKIYHEDRERLMVAHSRLCEAVRLANG